MESLRCNTGRSVALSSWSCAVHLEICSREANIKVTWVESWGFFSGALGHHEKQVLCFLCNIYMPLPDSGKVCERELLEKGVSLVLRSPCPLDLVSSPSPVFVWTHCTKQRGSDHGIIELFGLEGTFKGQLVQPHDADGEHHQSFMVLG